MFHWLTGGTSGEAGLERMRAEFCEMVDAGRHAFALATDALLGETSLQAVQKDLLKTDKRINRAERQIRKEIVVHASVHGTDEFAPCLVLMSIVKDAERLGDYAKDLFHVVSLAPQLPVGEHLEQFKSLRDRALSLLIDCHRAIEVHDEDIAVRVIVEAQKIGDLCDRHVDAFIRSSQSDELAVAYALEYRYFRRIASHTSNIASSVVQPLHKLDFTSKIISAVTDEQEDVSNETDADAG